MATGRKAIGTEEIGRGERIVAAVTSWPDVGTATGRFGETELRWRGREIGHVHGDVQADIPYPRRVRDELVAAGRVEPHHIHPDSGWTTYYLDSDADVAAVVELIRINYDRITKRAAGASS